MNKKIINVAQDFSPVPSGRYRNDGPATGEAFREDILRKALQENDVVIVELDGTEGYNSSFLEEAFGGAVRKGYLKKEDLGTRLIISAQQESYKHFELATKKYIQKAEAPA